MKPIESSTDLPFHAIEIEKVFSELATPPKSGLTTEEAEKRLAKYGPNRLEEAPPTSVWVMVWEQFNNFVVWLLVVASIISALLGDWPEAIAILLIVVLNAGLGVIQERRAEEALAALRQLAAPDAEVLRDGHRRIISSRELVPGDIVLLEAGNFIPADMRLTETINLRVEEAALTGESVPVQKEASRIMERDVPLGDRKNTAFMGTLVSYGRGRGVVVSTGMRTQIGLIAEMLQSVDQEQTPLQRRLDELGHTLGYAALFLCAMVFVLAVVRETDISLITAVGGGWDVYFKSAVDTITEAFLIAVSLAIAAVPEGLPAVVTISLALGMREMIQRNALIRRLSSVETLGSATVIGSDKTGTLTQNAMTVTHLWVDDQVFEVTGTGYEPIGEFQIDGETVNMDAYPGALTALWLGALNNDASLELGVAGAENEVKIVGDPTEGALLVAAAKAGALNDALASSYPRIQEIPFDSARKRMVTFHEVRDPHADDLSPFTEEQKQVNVAVIKGAPDVVLNLCTRYEGLDDDVRPLTDEMRQKVLAANDTMTGDALRVIGVAYRVEYERPDSLEPEAVEHDLVFAGLLGMIDPPRPEVAEALKKARKAGIRTVMITGDYPNTARAIAYSIGLVSDPESRVLTGTEIGELGEADFHELIKTVNIYARVSPEHKVRIVQAFRDNNQVVAMTGDGVNDAPALKRADIGVAMGITGTDVAKETADMVLTDDNYASIVDAVEQGRVIYSNIRKFVYFLLSCNLAEIAILFLAVLMGLPAPLEAIQLLWLNLVTDGAPALALGVEKGDPDTMDVPPRPPEEPIINKTMKIGLVTQTIFLTSVTLFAYITGLNLFPSDGHIIARTMAFLTLATAELPIAYVVRSERYPLMKIGPFKNRLMNWAVLSSLVLLLAVVYIPAANPIFHTTPIGWDQWRIVLPLIFIPAIGAEIVKLVTAKYVR